MDKNSHLIQKTETFLGLLPPDHGEAKIEDLKSRLFQQSGEAAFKALPGFIPLAAGNDLAYRFHPEDRHLPASPVVNIGKLLNTEGHLFLQVTPLEWVADFRARLLMPDKQKSPEIFPLAAGILLGPVAVEMDLDKIEVPCITISRFNLIIIEITYQRPRPWEHSLFWEILFEKPLKRSVS
ncbi:MAG: hypothetical protein JXR70_06760 [Spirochaetales bacterium]|nr:hypothetical protein [Spirochaetales bacterium]